ncbi:MAG: FAD-dependent oxidoreductase, partial [Puniceicoccaceae bacterium]|nr:FAD-dependent oxidoreductase [Puniceicoccaceae bacterium]
DNGSVKGIRLIKTEIDADGRLAQVKGSEFEIPCDMVLKASGQTKQADLLKKLLPDLELDAAGRIQTDPKNGLTSIPKVYAGGDAANGGREVVNAVAEGKKAARGMHSLFTGDSIQGPVQPSRLGAIGSPMGSGFDKPVRVSELEAAYHKQSTEK